MDTQEKHGDPRLKMDTQAKLEALRKICGKIRRCREELSPADLEGKYKKAFDTLLDDAASAATDCLFAALFVGLHCWCESEEEYRSLETDMERLINSETVQGGRNAATKQLHQGDFHGLASFLCRVRMEMRTLCVQRHGTEDEKEWTIWQTMILENMKPQTT